MRSPILGGRRAPLGIADRKERCRIQPGAGEHRRSARAPRTDAPVMHGCSLPAPTRYPNTSAKIIPKPQCGACDVCFGEVEGLTDATLTAQKILSCVARAGQQFGAEHIVDVLLGAQTERVRRWGHDKLTTYSLMKGTDRKSVTNMIYQLLDEGLLERTGDDRPVLKLNDASWAVLRSQRTVQLLQPKTKVRKSRFEEESWSNVDS